MMPGLTLTPAAITQAVTVFLAMLLSLTIHEAAHAWVAARRGDKTAARAGRLSLNPLVHIDPFGTVLLPLVGALSGLPVIGWAKPVPVDLSQLKHPKWDNVLVAAAGPVSNLLLAALALTLVHALPDTGDILSVFIRVNAYLAVFNLLPLPPLDGSAVFGAVLPYSWAQAYERLVAPYGFVLLILIVALGGLWWLPRLAEGYIIWVQKALNAAF